ncbi:hypothetical protein ACW9HJ_25230 [Nocardia gipuzkoensis]
MMNPIDDETHSTDDELRLDDLLQFAAPAPGPGQTRLTPQQHARFRLLALRGAWDRDPQVLLVHDPVADALLVRFGTAGSAAERSITGQLSVGIDEDAPDGRITSLCLLGYSGDTASNASMLARQLLGPTAWRTAEEMLTAGDGSQRRIRLTPDERRTLLQVWRTSFDEWDSHARPEPTPVLSDSEIEQYLSRWTIQFGPASAARGESGHRSASEPRESTEIGQYPADDASELEERLLPEGATVGDRPGATHDGAREIARLAQNGIDPRITWQTTDEPPTLTVRAAALDPDREFALGETSRVEVLVGGVTSWVALVGDGYGDLIARVALPTSRRGKSLDVYLRCRSEQ